MRLALAALATVVLLPAAASAQNVNPKQYGWHTDYAAAKAEARKTAKPMMLVFRCNP
jgi:hypothetical protein